MNVELRLRFSHKKKNFGTERWWRGVVADDISVPLAAGGGLVAETQHKTRESKASLSLCIGSTISLFRFFPSIAMVVVDGWSPARPIACSISATLSP